jgi:hypothetical protein
MLTRTNYTKWSSVMHVNLQASGLWEAIQYGGGDYCNESSSPPPCRPTIVTSHRRHHRAACAIGLGAPSCHRAGGEVDVRDCLPHVDAHKLH